jgi:hypothetical protein
MLHKQKIHNKDTLGIGKDIMVCEKPHSPNDEAMRKAFTKSRKLKCQGLECLLNNEILDHPNLKLVPQVFGLSRHVLSF